MSKELDAIQILIDALNFYSNPDHYWNDPLDINLNYCHKTLKDVQEAEKANLILQDRGKVAWDALMKFDKHIRILHELNECDKNNEKIKRI